MNSLLVVLRWTLLSLIGWCGYALLPLPGADTLTPARLVALAVLTMVSYAAVGWPVMRWLLRRRTAPEQTER